jgi:acetylornithine deacetylase/succinyl-diaminopimelate desuccinylase-like protein
VTVRQTEPSERLLNEVFDYLRIPSISSGGGDPADLLRAAEWLRDKIARAGGDAEVLTDLGNPLVVGELRAADEGAPTVLAYGHYDVQSPDPVEAWTTPPFSPEIRDGRIYARGASDDKGNFYPLLYVACELAQNNRLPVNVRWLIEGEEEVGGSSALEWLSRDERGADCALVFDSDMLDAETPALTLGLRGMAAFYVHVRCADRDLHSGMYGGAALNAVHVLHHMLSQVLPDPGGMLREELREGIAPPSPDELEAWSRFAPGSEVIAKAGGRPIGDDAALHFYKRNWGDASLDVNGFAGGDAVQARTIIPADASARFTIRLAPGQDAKRIGQLTEALLRQAAPPGAEIEIAWEGSDGVLFDPKNPALLLGAQALEEACGVAPALQRVGGSIPILKVMQDLQIPAIVSGFALADDAIHAVDESFRIASLGLGERAARKLYEKLANLRP